MLGTILTGLYYDNTIVILISGYMFFCIILLFSIEHVEKIYMRSLEDAFKEIADVPLIEIKEEKPLIQLNMQQSQPKPPRWSVMQYRGFNDFMFGSFDSYVTDEEIIIRGRLKKGQNSLYMRIVKPSRR